MNTDDAASMSWPSLGVTDGHKPDNAAESPASSTGAQSIARTKHVPIVRHKTGYERPERARTSHACEPCRERKTKCDGERPACRRCTHTGTNCHYGYGKGWKKRKTAEDLSTTSRKLARCEDLFSEIYPLVSPEVRLMIDDVRQQVFDDADAGETPTTKPTTVDGPKRAKPTSTTRTPHLIGTQSAPAMMSQEIHLPLTLENPVQMQSSKSPDPASSPALRLPSITPEGYLLEGAAASSRLSQTAFATRTESSPRKSDLDHSPVRDDAK